MLISRFSAFIIIVLYEFKNLHAKEIGIKDGDKIDICCTLQVQEKNTLFLWKDSIRLAVLNDNQLTEGDWAQFSNNYKDFKLEKRDKTICLIKDKASKADGNLDLKCTEVKGSFGETIQTEQISIKIFEELVFLTPLIDVTKLPAGQPLSIICEASGSPDLKVLWRKENEGVKSEGTSSARLVIDKITASMNGDKYTCEASISIPKDGPNSMKKQTTILDVLYPPEIIVEMKPIHTDIGLKEEVKITINGNPSPKLDCRLLNLDVDRIITISEPSPSTYVYKMVFENITQNHIGDYTCTATNSQGTVNKQISLILGPTNLRIISPNETTYANYYLLKWKVESKAKITLSKIVIDEYEAGIDSQSKKRIIESPDLLPMTKIYGNEGNNWQFEYHHNILNLTENKLHKISLQMCRKEQCIDAENAVYVQTPMSNGKNIMVASQLTSTQTTDGKNPNGEGMMTVSPINAFYILGINLVVLGLLH